MLNSVTIYNAGKKAWVLDKLRLLPNLFSLFCIQCQCNGVLATSIPYEDVIPTFVVSVVPGL